MISILFHHYKELLECIREVEELEAKVNGEDNKCSTIKEEETEEMEEIILTATTLDGFFFFHSVLASRPNSNKISPETGTYYNQSPWD